MNNSYAITTLIGVWQERDMVCELIQVQLELDEMATLKWRQKTSKALTAMFVSKPSENSAEGVIKFDITVVGNKAKAIYDLGCS